MGGVGSVPGQDRAGPAGVFGQVRVPELFRHVLGGYGLFGAILDADLDVVDNEMYSRKLVYMDYKDFPSRYMRDVENNPESTLAFARLSVSPGSYLKEVALHAYTRAQFEGPLPPLKPSQHSALFRFVINFSKTGGLGRCRR